MSAVAARALVPWVAAVAVAAGALLMRAELMTVHEGGRTGASEVVVGARTKGAPELLEPRARALITTCRLLVGSGLQDPALREVEPSVYAFRVEPALDEFDERELRGCLQDLRVEHVLLHVREVRHHAVGGS